MIYSANIVVFSCFALAQVIELPADPDADDAAREGERRQSLEQAGDSDLLSKSP